jgi:hypothetical protein
VETTCLSFRREAKMPYRAGKPAGRLIPRRLMAQRNYGLDLRGIGLPAGLILRDNQ